MRLRNQFNIGILNMQAGVIAYLSCLRDAHLLITSLHLLYKNYNDRYNYPVIVFHDDLSLPVQANIRNQLFSRLGRIPNIKFVEIQFTFPAHISQNPADYNPGLDRFRLGYRHMCQFFAGEMYKHPALASYKWLWRLDSDSFLLSSINYDIFEYMAKNDIKYGYMAEYDGDSEETSVGFEETVLKYFTSPEQRERLQGKFVAGNWDRSVFYTNFLLADLDYMRSSEYQEYFEYINRTGNIYYRRWGDHIIQWFGINAMINPAQIWCVKDIAYQHGGWVKNTAYIDPSLFEIIPEPYRQWAVAAHTLEAKKS